MQQFTFITVIRAPRSRVFHFHDDPSNLIRITPHNIRIVVDSFETPVRAGSKIALTVYFLRIVRTSWVMKISRYKPGEIFEDTMVSGPFKEWVHTRTFSGSGDTTTLTETVRYSMPLGIFGRIADALVFAPVNRRMFLYRQKRMKELLERGD